MAEKVDIFMPLYVADYLADTTDLSTEEHGAYFLLLLTSWRSEGVLPNDPRRLARIAKVPFERWPDIWEAIGRFFDVDGATISQGRLVEERAKALRLKQASSEGGKKSADSRRAKNGTAQPSKGVRSGFDEASEATSEATAEGSSNISESPSQADLSPAARDPSATDLWGATRWLELFTSAWEKANKGIFYGRGAGDNTALETLQASLNALPPEGRLAAQIRAPDMFAEFLADDSAKARKERWQFSYFVLLFNGLRVAKPKAPEQPLRCAWHAKGGKGASRNPVDSCPECREDRARSRGRSGDPAPIGGVVATFKPLAAPKNPATPKQIDALRLERKGARASPAPADLPTPPASPKAAAGGTS